MSVRGQLLSEGRQEVSCCQSEVRREVICCQSEVRQESVSVSQRSVSVSQRSGERSVSVTQTSEVTRSVAVPVWDEGWCCDDGEKLTLLEFSSLTVKCH